jgi:hypothetical protein
VLITQAITKTTFFLIRTRALEIVRVIKMYFGWEKDKLHFFNCLNSNKVYQLRITLHKVCGYLKEERSYFSEAIVKNSSEMHENIHSYKSVISEVGDIL